MRYINAEKLCSKINNDDVLCIFQLLFYSLQLFDKYVHTIQNKIIFDIVISSFFFDLVLTGIRSFSVTMAWPNNWFGNQTLNEV